jgi:hypothetical protein
VKTISLFNKYQPDTMLSTAKCTVQATAEARPDMFSGTLYANTRRCYPAKGKIRERCFMDHENGETEVIYGLREYVHEF